MKTFPTLFDQVMSSTFAKDQQASAFLGPRELRQKIFSARRFTLDDSMSGFLADLASQAFVVVSDKGVLQKNADVQLRAIEAMRTGARLPHCLTWIEYNLRKTHTRLRDYGNITTDGKPINNDPSAVPLQEGWLLEQHPQVDTAFRMTLYTASDMPDVDGFQLWQFPWAYCWNTTDDPLPWKTTPIEVINQHGDTSRTTISDVVVGLFGYHTPHVGVQASDTILHASKSTQQHANNLLKEWTGVVRRMWALLSTINDLPVVLKDVRPSKGYMAGRNYRRFLDHKVITLTVPQAEYRKLARQVVAKARRRAHQVRGHFRNDWVHPLSPLCEHTFVPHERHLECSICKGRKLWIREHQRGDASLGHVTHDYTIEHPKETVE